MFAVSALRKLSREVWLLGAVSLLSDAAADLVYPLLPALLGSALVLGAMEGVAELLSSFVKVWAGRANDRGVSRARLVVGGYATAALARPLMAVITASWQAIFVRTLDRAGKGLRGAPRDAILSACTPPEHRGLAFGLHQGMDNLGAVVGPLLAMMLLSWGHLSLRATIACAIVPGSLSVLLAWRVVSRTRDARAIQGPRRVAPTGHERLGPRARALIVASGLFASSVSADSFLMQRLGDLGLALAWIPTAWVTLQLAKSILNAPGGALADRIGPRRVLVVSWAVYAVAYVAFAFVTNWRFFWAILPLYALHYGLGEGTSKALMARLVPASQHGTAFGTQQAVQGLALLPANLVFGLLYLRGPKLAFLYSAAFAAVATLVLVLVTRDTEGGLHA